MPLDLDRLELRILGVLIEKERTVPETYPLTLNALVSGCNQKSNRDPHMSVEPYEVEGALRSLMDREFAIHMEKVGGRAARYEHRCPEQLGVDEAELAILAELMNRGPQTPGELKTRASRMHALASPAEVEARLRELATRPVPYVRQLERRPREHAARWEHLLGTQYAQEETATVEAASEPPAETGVAAPASQAPAPAAPPVPARVGQEFLERIDALEREVGDLRNRLIRLEGL